jgi:hypothetical protein
MIGLKFSGEYAAKGNRIVGQIEYVMPARTMSITGASFEKTSDPIVVPIDLPVSLDPDETYRIETPLGPLNTKFIRHISL